MILQWEFGFFVGVRVGFVEFCVEDAEGLDLRGVAECVVPYFETNFGGEVGELGF